MWNIIAPNKIKQTVWENIDDEKVEIDTNFIENNFVKKDPKK